MGFTTKDVIRLKKYYIKTYLKTESIDSGKKTKSYSITEFIGRYFCAKQEYRLQQHKALAVASVLWMAIGWIGHC